jgi:hypothetical protein
MVVEIDQYLVNDTSVGYALLRDDTREPIYPERREIFGKLLKMLQRGL